MYTYLIYIYMYTYLIFIYIYVYIWGLFKIMLPQNLPFANFSQIVRKPFADFSPTKMSLKTHVSWEDGRVFQFQY